MYDHFNTNNKLMTDEAKFWRRKHWQPEGPKSDRK